ncbi:hypothetical protein [Chloroflexus sp.]|uniref:hypothetical protein n=1 Tax=Chloroflexus sp. TaxID=1904827 RepID=UPI002630053D|nr:hypothetical protein [uncultured Chloroflexus sp.]
MNINQDRENAYLDLLLKPIRICADYKPGFGRGKRDGLTLEQFRALYKNDQFYQWFGLDHLMMYTAHRIAGGMTSIYRQIGIGCEKLFRTVLRDALGLSDQDVIWSYKVTTSSGQERMLSLDGRVLIESIAHKDKQDIFREWMRKSAERLGVDPGIINTLKEVVFEVRQGYKSKDAKRQNADIANAATAYIHAYLPCAAILSTQIDNDILKRYQRERWVVITGERKDDPFTSTYAFARQIIGYDLEAFFKKHCEDLRREVVSVLESLLSSEDER